MIYGETDIAASPGSERDWRLVAWVTNGGARIPTRCGFVGPPGVPR